MSRKKKDENMTEQEKSIEERVKEATDALEKAKKGESTRKHKTHGLELYPDCIDHYTFIYDLLHNQFPYEYGYAMIYHDMDRLETGELKKPHYHVIFATMDGISHVGFIKRIHKIYPKIMPNYFYYETREHGIRYLCHADDPDKYQYNQDTIISRGIDVSRYYERQFVAEREDKILCILDHINSYPKESREELLRWVVNHNLYDEYRRAYSMINDIIKERKDRLTYNEVNEVIRIRRDIVSEVNSLKDVCYNMKKDISKLNNDRVMYLREVDKI